MSSPLPLALQAGEGARVSFANIDLFIKADSAATNGHCSAFEYNVPARFPGPALHYHRRMEEIFYVLEGTVTFHLGDKKTEARQGAFVYVPAGSIHTFSNPSDKPARMLVIDTPGGFEGYFEGLSRLMAKETDWPPADTSRLVNLMAEYDTYPAGV